MSNDNSENEWTRVIEENSLDFTNALNIFIDLVKDNLEALDKIEVSTEMITFWYIYAYEGQCIWNLVQS